MKVTLNGIEFEVAKDRAGEPIWNREPRPSEPGDPGDLQFAEWQTWGPDFNSFEQIGPGAQAGFLGRDYGTNTDGRWFGMDMLGPLISTVTCSTHDSGDTVEDAHGMATMNVHSNAFGWVARGTRPAKIKLSDMSLQDCALSFAAVVTDVIATRAQLAGTLDEISFALGDATPYQTVKRSAVGNPGNDSASGNDQSQGITTFGLAPDRVVGLTSNSVLGNVLTGAITMDASAWFTVSVLDGLGAATTLTGFATDGDYWIIATSDGPYMLDKDTREFRALIPEIDNHSENGKGATNWSFLGAVIPLRYAVRYQRNLSGESFGPEVFEGNTSPVQGHTHGFAASARWGYAVFHNPVTGDSWLAAARPRQAGDPHPHPVSWFTLAQFDSVHSEFVHFIGTADDTRTLETLVGGYDDDIFYMQEGRTARFPDDSAYVTALSGTTRYTELRRQPDVIKDVESVTFESDDCTGADTITVSIAITREDGSTVTPSFPVVTTNGFHRLLTGASGQPDANFHGGRRMQPQAAFAAAASTSSPKIIGTLRVYYRIRMRTVRVFTGALDLSDSVSNTHSVRDLEDALYEMLEAGPVELEVGGETLYVRVNRTPSRTTSDASAGNPSGSGERRRVEVVMTEWATAA